MGRVSLTERPALNVAGLTEAVDHLLQQQHDNGCWEGEVVWCPIILAQYVLVCAIVGKPIREADRRLMVRHFEVARTPEGGWGLHQESGPYVFVTTLSYVALRLLGTPANDDLVAPALRWLHAQPEGVLSIPSWGKSWLALAGLYEYEGLHPIAPELYSAPRWLPGHPSKLYCHTRYIYLGMSYLYGSRFRADLGPISGELKKELYDRPYEQIDFAKYRNHVAPSDLFLPPGMAVRTTQALMTLWEAVCPSSLRKGGLESCYQRILFEQRATRYQGISPVSGLLNCLALWSRDQDSSDLRESLAGLEAWKWQDLRSGIRYAGARSQTWDTAFAMQTLLENDGSTNQSAGALARAHDFLRGAQMDSDIPGREEQDRDSILGGWCFSDGEHRWPVSDCTAEALSAVLKAESVTDMIPQERRISPDLARRAAEFILERQNSDGGFSTYERRRGPLWLEKTNPSEMFSNCMVEGSFVECTASALKALAEFRKGYPDRFGERIGVAMQRAVTFLRRRQRDDGSFEGAWGINFTYGTFFAVEGLLAGGVPKTDPALSASCRWLVQSQQPDGGWGEHYSSCRTHRYVPHQSQVVMTSWALLALLNFWPENQRVVERGIEWLRRRQLSSGGWPDNTVNGVFFGSAMLDYRLYQAYFPTWALARYAAKTSGS